MMTVGRLRARMRRMREEAEKALGDAGRWRELTEVIPLGRGSEPEEIAAAVAFLASPWSAATTATTLAIDGAQRSVKWELPRGR